MRQLIRNACRGMAGPAAPCWTRRRPSWRKRSCERWTRPCPPSTPPLCCGSGGHGASDWPFGACVSPAGHALPVRTRPARRVRTARLQPHIGHRAPRGGPRIPAQCLAEPVHSAERHAADRFHPAEFRAAERAGLRFLGYAPYTEQAQALLAAGAQPVLNSLEPVLYLLRQTPPPPARLPRPRVAATSSSPCGGPPSPGPPARRVCGRSGRHTRPDQVVDCASGSSAPKSISE